MRTILMLVCVAVSQTPKFEALDASSLPKWLTKEQRQQVVDLQAERLARFNGKGEPVASEVARAAHPSWAPWMPDDAQFREGQIVKFNTGKVVASVDGGIVLKVYFGRVPRHVYVANVVAADDDFFDARGVLVLGLKKIQTRDGTRTLWHVRRFWE